jgi:hypothetical protein
MELKILPVAATPHQSKTYRLILDLLFQLRLKNGSFRDAVNDTTVKMGAGGVIDQIGGCLPKPDHPCLCGSRGRRQHIYDKMGHQGWILENGLVFILAGAVCKAVVSLDR